MYVAETGPEPCGNGDYHEPEPIPQPACLFAKCHKVIISKPSRRIKANQDTTLEAWQV